MFGFFVFRLLNQLIDHHALITDQQVDRSTGTGLIFILRWFWWRINAAAELAAMLGGFIIGSITSTSSIFNQIDFGYQLLIISVATALLWIVVMYLTPPESDATLDEFYLQVRPGGIGWQRQRERTGIAAEQDLGRDILKVIAASLLLFGSMLAIGGFLLLKPLTGWVCLIMAVLGGFWLRQLNKRKIAPMSSPGLRINDE